MALEPLATEPEEFDIWEVEQEMKRNTRSSYRNNLNLDGLGRCGTCQNLNCVVTKLGKVFARCNVFGGPISQHDPPIECTCYVHVNTKPISYYFALGIEIDRDKKSSAGF